MSSIAARTRFLARIGHGGVLEYFALEVSLSRQQVKLKPLHGEVFWASRSDIHLVEILQDVSNPTPLKALSIL